MTYKVINKSGVFLRTLYQGENRPQVLENVFCSLVKNEALAKTEHEYKAELKQKNKMHLLRLGTPELLLLEETSLVLGQQLPFTIRWIEYKSYSGMYKKYTDYEINKQIEKYNRNFGKGLIVFDGGFEEKLIQCIKRHHDSDVLGIQMKITSK